jgi:glutathione synthase/RimK-type ligase-like ATP-grasp enzyme
MTDAGSTFVLGWEEWVALPDLGLPAIKAKVDTGARTSALHAFLIEPFGPIAAPMVRFGLHPIPNRTDIEIYCSAPVFDRREVTSSNGEREVRCVIQSRIEIANRSWPIELTLTNRESMSYRMLVGRQAIRDDVFVDPAASFRQPKLSYKLYRHLPRQDLVRRALRIAVVTSAPERPFNRRLAAAAAARGHVLELIDSRTLSFDAADEAALGQPILSSHAVALAHYDAVISRARLADGALPIAAVRQLTQMGATAINPADALDRLRLPISVVQTLAHAGIAVMTPTLDPATGEIRWASRRDSAILRCIVVGGRVEAAVEGRRRRLHDAGERRHRPARRLAEAAVKRLDLGLAAVDVLTDTDRPMILRVSGAPALGTAEAATGARLAEAVVADVERRVRSWVRREDAADAT